jgi:hypothetical protein
MRVAGLPDATFGDPDLFAAALRKTTSEAEDIELLFAIWEGNVETVRALNKYLKQTDASRAGVALSLVQHLKACAIALVNVGNGDGASSSAEPNDTNEARRPKIDKSLLTISEPKRHRSKEHLRFVARQPCLICGRTPSHAHHVRFAQSRGLGLKVSDEFTVPLCAIHHSQNHQTGNEKQWWEDRKLDPLAVAQELWQLHLNGSQTPFEPNDEVSETKKTNAPLSE